MAKPGRKKPPKKRLARRGARDWPVVRAYVPIPDVWRATGLGSAGVLRRQPDGRYAYAMFPINLLDRGIGMMIGRGDMRIEEVEHELAGLRDVIPPFEEGPPELASAYVWGAKTYGETEGYGFPPREEARFLALVPEPPGTPPKWLTRLIGKGGLAPAGLMDVIEAMPVDEDIPEQMEQVVFTEMTFDLDEAEAAAEHLRAGAPADGGLRFAEVEPRKGEVASFDWVRPYPKGHWSPLRLLGGMQILGSVGVTRAALVAEARTLSMAARLVWMLKERLGGAIRLRDTRWTTPEAMRAAG